MISKRIWIIGILAAVFMLTGFASATNGVPYICHLTDPNNNDFEGIDVKVIAYDGTISVEYLGVNSDTDGAIKTIGINIPAANIIEIKDPSGATWTAAEKPGPNDWQISEFGTFLSKTDDPSPSTKSAGPIIIKHNYNLGVPPQLPTNSDGYAIVVHVFDLNDPTPNDGEDDTSTWVSGTCTLTEIPEFPTMALPIAAILGLAFFFQRRRD